MGVEHEDRRYDAAVRRNGHRMGAERGIRIYIPAAELRRAGFDPHDDPPTYKVWGSAGGGIRLRLYKT